jgi:hypothetical protein
MSHRWLLAILVAVLAACGSASDDSEAGDASGPEEGLSPATASCTPYYGCSTYSLDSSAPNCTEDYVVCVQVSSDCSSQMRTEYAGIGCVAD